MGSDFISPASFPPIETFIVLVKRDVKHLRDMSFSGKLLSPNITKDELLAL